MITKERLEELIEQGTTIYTSGYRESCCFKNEIIVDLAKLDYFNKTKTYSIKDFGGGDFVLLTGYTCDNGCDEYLTPDELFETQEEAEWHKEFGCIERTERLELPTWEEFQKDGEFSFLDKQGYGWDLYSIDDETRISLVGGYNHFEYEYNKENYTLACRKAKELFLNGVNNDID